MIIEPVAMISGLCLGLFLGTASSLIGWVIRYAIRWMGA